MCLILVPNSFKVIDFILVDQYIYTWINALVGLEEKLLRQNLFFLFHILIEEPDCFDVILHFLLFFLSLMSNVRLLKFYCCYDQVMLIVNENKIWFYLHLCCYHISEHHYVFCHVIFLLRLFSQSKTI